MSNPLTVKQTGSLVQSVDHKESLGERQREKERERDRERETKRERERKKTHRGRPVSVWYSKHSTVPGRVP